MFQSPMKTRIILAAIGLLLSPHVSAQLEFERILNAAYEPHNWLTYNGSYSSQRYSQLNQITQNNVDELELF